MDFIPEQNENKSGTEDFAKYQREKQKEFYRRGIWTGVIIGVLCLTAVFLGYRLFSMQDGNKSQASVLTDVVKDKMGLLEDTIQYYYLNSDEVDKDNMAEGIYSGMLKSLGDPYSVYYTADEFKSMMDTSEGIYYGIGAYLQQDIKTGVITIVRPMEGSPAMEAGLKPEDIIFKVNDEEVTGRDLTAVVTEIKGAEGTTVKLTIVREGETDYLEFDVERRDVEVPTVISQMLPEQIGYIQITEFDSITLEQFQKAYNELNNGGMKSLIIDLRSNGGGNLDTVVEIADILLPKGLIVYQEDKNGERREYFSDEERQFDKPMAVLVNGYSASASEILAGAIKDYKAGTLIGTTTFGKGIVQSVIPLGDDTAIKLTISKYFTPNGNYIHDIGIEPDIEVEFDGERYDTENRYETDNQLDKAMEVLKKQL